MGGIIPIIFSWGGGSGALKARQNSQLTHIDQTHHILNTTIQLEGMAQIIK